MARLLAEAEESLRSCRTNVGVQDMMLNKANVDDDDIRTEEFTGY